MSEAYLDEFAPDDSIIAEELTLAEQLVPTETIIHAAGNTALHAVSLEEIPSRVIGKSREINGKDSVGLYIEEISRTPLLNAEKEVELSKRIEAGLYASYKLENDLCDSATHKEELEWLALDGANAKEEFLTANLRLVVSLAKLYWRSKMPMGDLVQEGNTGLIRAVEKFDFTKGYKFSTYATWWVRQAITRGIAMQARTVRLPVHVVEEINQISSARRQLARRGNHDPSHEEIARELASTPDRVRDLLQWSQDTASLDEPVGGPDSDISLNDLINGPVTVGGDTPEQSALSGELKQEINALLRTLDDRHADILRRRFGLGTDKTESLGEIAKVWGVSYERMRQLEREALSKLRKIAPEHLNHT